MKRVLKWSVPVDDQEHFIGGGPVSHVAMEPGTGYGQNTPPVVNIWTEEPLNGENPVRSALVVGTGHSYADGYMAVGSCRDGIFVWHVVMRKGKGSTSE